MEEKIKKEFEQGLYVCMCSLDGKRLQSQYLSLSTSLIRDGKGLKIYTLTTEDYKVGIIFKEDLIKDSKITYIGIGDGITPTSDCATQEYKEVLAKQREHFGGKQFKDLTLFHKCIDTEYREFCLEMQKKGTFSDYLAQKYGQAAKKCSTEIRISADKETIKKGAIGILFLEGNERSAEEFYKKHFNGIKMQFFTYNSEKGRLTFRGDSVTGIKPPVPEECKETLSCCTM